MCLFYIIGQLEKMLTYMARQLKEYFVDVSSIVPPYLFEIWGRGEGSLKDRCYASDIFVNLFLGKEEEFYVHFGQECFFLLIRNE